jgi:arsenate reductase
MRSTVGWVSTHQITPENRGRKLTITITHNPKCGTSRNTLAILKAAGYEPEVIDYQSEGWQVGQLRTMFSAAGATARQALRADQAKKLELSVDLDDEALIKAMVQHPILVNRPFVTTPKGTALCRPCEKVLDLIDQWPAGPFAKENGEVIIDADGNRV